MDVLVVGAGIAGPTLAYWLARTGHGVTLVERSPGPRRGGYLIDFWGAGFDVAERMGIAQEVRRRGVVLDEARAVDHRGRRIGSIRPASVMGSRARYVSIPRTDLADVIRGALDDRVQVRFDDTVASLDDDGARVAVTFASGSTATFDLVVGADGLHSRVRALAFGPPERFERYLGVVVAAFQVQGYRPRDESAALMHAGVGYQVVRVSVGDDSTLFLVTLREAAPLHPRDTATQQDLLRSRLATAGWEVPRALEAMTAAESFYCDDVSQVRMPSWSRGRITLVGDAAACPSLLAGQGSAMAMVEAYVLAACLQQAPDCATALAVYQRRLAAFVRSKQDGAVGLGTAFAPPSRTKLAVRNLSLRLMGIPKFADLVMGRSFRDELELPEVQVA